MGKKSRRRCNREGGQMMHSSVRERDVPDGRESPSDSFVRLVGREIAGDMASHFKNTFLDASRQDPDNPWNPERVSPFLAYMQMFCGVEETVRNATKDDLKFFKKIAFDRSEPVLFRAGAFTLLGEYLLSNLAYEDSAQCFDETIKLCDSVTDDESYRTVTMMRPGSNEPLASWTVGEFLGRIKTDAERTLAAARDDGFQFAAGHKCDTCGKHRAELGVEEFEVCQTCQMAYYCSRSCQKKAWKAGHKKGCRAEGEFKVGDLVYSLEPIEGSIDRGGIVEVVRPASDEQDLENPSRWVVRPISSDDMPTSVIPAARLKRMRPAQQKAYRSAPILHTT